MASTTAQDEINRFVSLINQKASFGINVGEFAKVKEFNKSTMTVDVVPMIDDVGGDDEAASINECPVLLQCLLNFDDKNPKEPHRPVYRELKAGDVVFIVFSNRNLDNFDGKHSYQKQNERMHSINDAVVVGRLVVK